MRIFGAGVAGLLVVFLLVTIGIYSSLDVSPARGIMTYTPPYKSYTREGGLGVQGNLKMKDMPLDLILAIIVREDLEFPSDVGVRVGDIYRVVYDHITQGQMLFGASTITQQVAKNLFTGAKRSYLRKYTETLYALKLERNFSKEEIFELYVNLVETAPDTYGFSAGAAYYFQKPASELTAIESVFMAYALASPKRYTSWFTRGTEDKLAYSFMAHYMRRLLLFKEQLADVDAIGADEKKEFFSRYLLQSKNTGCINYEHYSLPARIWGMREHTQFLKQVRAAETHDCISKQQLKRAWKKANTIAAEFIRAHWKGDPTLVGLPH